MLCHEHGNVVSQINPSRPNLGWTEKNKLNFYFYTSLWCLKRFNEGVKGLHKTFWGTRKKYENKNLTQFLFQYNFQKSTGREGLMDSRKYTENCFFREILMEEFVYMNGEWRLNGSCRKFAKLRAKHPSLTCYEYLQISKTVHIDEMLKWWSSYLCIFYH